MLSDCRPCREAGAVCRTNPKLAVALHKNCNIVDCPCFHIIPADAHEYVTSRVDG